MYLDLQLIFLVVLCAQGSVLAYCVLADFYENISLTTLGINLVQFGFFYFTHITSFKVNMIFLYIFPTHVQYYIEILNDLPSMQHPHIYSTKTELTYFKEHVFHIRGFVSFSLLWLIPNSCNPGLYPDNSKLSHRRSFYTFYYMFCINYVLFITLCRNNEPPQITMHRRAGSGCLAALTARYGRV